MHGKIAIVFQLLAAASVVVLLTFAVAANATPTPEAQESHEGHSDASKLIWMAINAAVLFYVVIRYGKKPLAGMLAADRKTVADAISAAERARKEAEAKVREYTARLAKLDAEIGDLKSRMAAEAEAERRRIVKTAAETADKIRAEAKQMVEQEAKQAQQKLTQRAAELAVELATALLRKETTEADRRRLAADYVEQMKPGQPASHGAGGGK